MKMIKKNQLKIVIFTAVRYRSILNGRHRNVIMSVISVIDESSRLPSEMPLL